MSVRRPLMLVTFVIVMGCTIRFDWPDHRVELAVLPEHDVMQTVTGDGTELRIEDAEIVIRASELETCDAVDARRRDLPGFSALAPSLAYAHIQAASTTDATPRVVGAVAAQDVVVAELAPPAGSYCAIVLELGPLPGDEAPMGGSSARIVGDERPAGHPEWKTFEWRTGAKATIRLSFDEPLELGDESQHLRLGVRLNFVQWFAAIEQDTPPDEAAYRVLEAAVGAVEFER